MPGMVPRWEYKLVSHPDDFGLTMEQYLNKLGVEGWELVGVSSYSWQGSDMSSAGYYRNPGGVSTTYALKRPWNGPPP